MGKGAQKVFSECTQDSSRKPVHKLLGRSRLDHLVGPSHPNTLCGKHTSPLDTWILLHVLKCGRQSKFGKRVCFQRNRPGSAGKDKTTSLNYSITYGEVCSC